MRSREILISSKLSTRGSIEKRVERNLWSGNKTKVEIKIMVNSLTYLSGHIYIENLQELSALGGEILYQIKNLGGEVDEDDDLG